ncbi:MAG: enoyl-CoA hydratase/isomerase family protein [Frankiales bacterium]|nr:enoyl-CoA hydratase/isomerase family protein [Frankiales bacterium]
MADTVGLRFHREGAVLTLTLDRPDVHNALDWRTREALVAALADASADLAVRAVVLTGSGERAFCTGADLRVPLPAPPKPADAPERAQGEVARGIATGWQRLVTAVLDCEKPVVAAVNGTAAGAGMHLALACDVIVMAETAKLVPVFVRRGIAPDAAGAYLLTRLVGPQVAKRLYLFGDDVSASEVAGLGIVANVVPAGDVLATAQALAARLATGPTRTLAITKRLVNRALDLDRDSALAEEAWAQELVMTTQDAQEGVRAFIERRDAEFRGW